MLKNETLQSRREAIAGGWERSPQVQLFWGRSLEGARGGAARQGVGGPGGAGSWNAGRVGGSNPVENPSF